MNILVRDVAIGKEKQRFDVRVRRGKVAEVAPLLAQHAGEKLVDGEGGWLVPALADDHLHLGAWLRAMRSAPFPPHGLDSGFCGMLDREGPRATGWTVLFGIDHHDDAARELALLDRDVHHPVLLVHRTGHAAVANRLGEELLARQGLRLDHVSACWRSCLGEAAQGEEDALLSRLRDGLLAAGVAHIRDATPSPSGMAGRAERLARALWPVRVSFMGLPGDPLATATHLKLFDLAAPDHPDRPLAVHAVEPYEIHWACQAVGERGRVEHASVCPEPLVEMLAATGCTVCLNPGFFVDRAAALAPMRESGEAQFYQPLADLLAAGARVTFGSDAPVGEPGPWASIRGACARGEGALRFPGERLGFEDALRCCAVEPALVDAPAGDWVGRDADFAVLAAGAAQMKSTDAPVGATVIGGRVAFHFSGAPAHG